MKKPKLPKTLPRALQRRPKAEERAAEALSDVPRITNETVAEHREEVLSSARKYIYPLQHSKRRVVAISTSLLAAALVIFLVYTALALYKFQNTSGFMYDVTRVIPFPVAKAGDAWVSYESYLFELKRNLHYYETQQKINFADPNEQQQLARYKSQAMDRVVNDAYVKKLAQANHVSVSNGEVNDEVNLLKRQNRLGSSDQMFATVLQEFWGWSENDFRRELKQQLLAQKVVAKLDTATTDRANQALKQLQGGADFAKLAAKVSDDVGTRKNGGAYPGAIDAADRDVPPQITDALAKLQPGQISGIINTGYNLEIVKLLDKKGGKLHAAHIQFNFKDIATYIQPLKDKHKPHTYIDV